jgi:hypothetical protein
LVQQRELLLELLQPLPVEAAPSLLLQVLVLGLQAFPPSPLPVASLWHPGAAAAGELPL